MCALAIAGATWIGVALGVVLTALMVATWEE